jgi:hypothetical protein
MKIPNTTLYFKRCQLLFEGNVIVFDCAGQDVIEKFLRKDLHTFQYSIQAVFSEKK